MSRRYLLSFLPFLVVVILITSLTPLVAAQATIITVTNTDNTGPGSLRQAITDALAGDTIAFNIPGSGVQTIIPDSPLPSLPSSVIIDGYTQPGSNPATGSTSAALLIEIDGENAGNSTDGLTLTDNNTVRGLVINRFGGSGIRVNSGPGNVIEGNIIGLDAAGTAALGNGAVQGGFGIYLFDASENTIGGTAAAARNIISGNGNSAGWSGGILLTTGSTSNLILGNYIGTDISGTLALGNVSQGINVDHSAGNTIGGLTAGARNIISGNGGPGINIFDTTATNNIILGNYIGTDVTGTAALGNTQSGVSIWAAPNNIIGGTESGARNLISGNGNDGISLGGTLSGTQVQGNYIGTDVTGNLALGNGYQGIFMSNASNSLIGGTTPGAGNVISANDGGIMLFDACDGTLIQGNMIGTNASGTAALGNNHMGLWIAKVQHVVIGGTTPGVRNVISGNGLSGFGFGIYFNEDSKNNTVQGNYIGTDITGTLPIGNAIAGIALMRSSNNLIGGNTAAARNIISGNAVGVTISGNGLPGEPLTPSDDNIIQGNFIGTDVTGTLALPNLDGGIEVSNGFDNGVHNNIIGGSGPGEGNVISGNGHAGIFINNNAVGTQVVGNYIGTDVTGVINLGNDLYGVYIQNAADNTIGGTIPSARNVITHNGKGVVIAGAVATGNQILGNSIFANTDIGIDLDDDGVTDPDPDDADTGPNNLQNYPLLSNAEATSTTIEISGAINTEADKSYRLEFFANPACSPSDHGEGRTYLGFTNVLTDGNGDATFTMMFTASVPAGQFISATATDPDHNTSEFSACKVVKAPSAPEAAPSRNYYRTLDVTVSWSGISWAEGYIVQWDENGDFSNPTSLPPLAASELSADISLPEDGVYFWRVRALNAAGTNTTWSNPQSFTVEVH